MSTSPPAMSLSAAHHVTEQMAERNAVVRQHNQIGVTLTLGLSLLVLAFESADQSAAGSVAGSTEWGAGLVAR